MERVRPRGTTRVARNDLANVLCEAVVGLNEVDEILVRTTRERELAGRSRDVKEIVCFAIVAIDNAGCCQSIWATRLARVEDRHGRLHVMPYTDVVRAGKVDAMSWI